MENPTGTIKKASGLQLISRHQPGAKSLDYERNKGTEIKNQQEKNKGRNTNSDN
jgi:hypothetical protein